MATETSNVLTTQMVVATSGGVSTNNSSSINSSSTTSSSSSSISTLFERVTNFRRSLIKSQNKKNKIRPPSGSFSFLKHSASNLSIDSKMSASDCSAAAATVNLSQSVSSSALIPTSNGHTHHHSPNGGSSQQVPVSSSHPVPNNYHPGSSDSNNDSTVQYSSVSLCAAELQTAPPPPPPPPLPPSHSHQQQRNHHQQHRRNSIIVDEEDAIYGFTSSHLNNAGPVRRHLKLQSANHHQNGTGLIGGQASSSSSSTLTSRTTASSSSSTSSPPHPIYAGTGPITTNGSIHNTSSSCVSLYETIDEVESTATLPPLKQNCARTKVLPPPPPLPASYKLRGKALRSHDSDWKRNRRSSAIIFGTDFSSNDNDAGDQNVDDFEDETSASASGTVNHHRNHQGQQAGLYSSGNRPSRSHHLSSSIFHRHSSVSSGPLPPMPPCPSSSIHSMHRSSDDLLMMSSSYQQPGPYHNNHQNNHLPAFPNQPNRIYENVVNHHNHRQKPSQQHHSRAASNSLSTSKRCDSRKLTKDSGYESASTLVNSSLTQLNQLPNLSASDCQLPLPPPPPPPAAPPVSTFFFGGNNSGTYRHQSNQSSINHSRSQSIDSTLSSNGNGNGHYHHRSCNVGDDNLRSLTPPIANNHNHNNKRFCQNGTSPNHQNHLPLPPPPPPSDDSPPPTPPVRCSSLAENHRSSTRVNSNSTTTSYYRNGRVCGGAASASVDEDDDLEEELDQMIMSDGIVVSGSNLDPNGTSHHRQHSHQLDQLSTKQLYHLVRDLAPGSATAVSVPPPVLPPKKTGIRMPIEYHHVKQDSWPPLSYGANGTAAPATAAPATTAINGNGNFGYASSQQQQQQSPNNNRRSRHSNHNNNNSNSSNSNHHQQPSSNSSNYHRKYNNCGTTETVSSSSMITQSLTSLLANHPMMNDRQRLSSNNNKTTPGSGGHGRHSIASCGTNSTVSNSSSSSTTTTTTSTTSLNSSRIPTTTSTSSANANGGGGGGAYLAAAAQHQIAHSRQVQQIARQESATMIVNQKQQSKPANQLNGRHQANRRYSLELLDSSSESNHNNLEQSNSKPPPLPPKSFQSSMSINGHPHNFDKQAEMPIFSNGAATNGEKQNYKRSVSHNETIKEIQKRAVYEFYLREKEKKNKNKTNCNNQNTTNGTREQSNLDNSNFNSKPNGTGSHVSRNSQINNNANNKHRTNEFELRYNNHIKHLNGDNGDLEVTNNGEFEEEEEEGEEELPLPPPPPPSQQQQLPLLSTDLDEFYVPPSTVVSNNFETTFTASRSICTTIRNRSPSPAPSRESPASPSLPLPPPPPVQFSNSPPNSPNALDLPPPPTPTTPSENHNGTTNGGPTSSEFFLNQRMSLALPPLEHHGCTILTESVLSSALSLSSSNCQLGYLQRRQLVNKFMFYDIDFASLWPIVDFGRIWPSGDVNLWLANGMVVNGGHKSTVNNGEEDEEEEEEEIDDEELVNIELNHRNKQQLIDQISLLRTRQAKLKMEYDDNEKIGQLIRDRLTALDSNNNNNNNNGAKGDSAANMASKEELRSESTTKPQSQPSLSHDRQKLDLFCNDMIMIVRLIVSIVEQVNRNTTVQTNNINKHQLIRVVVADSQHGDLTSASASFGPTKIESTIGHEDNADTAERSDDESPISDSFDQKQSRLFGQLAEAKRLRDNIETRRTMLEQRLRRKAASCTAASATSSTSSSSSSSSSPSSSSISACGGIFVINLEQLNLATSSSVAASVISALNVTSNNHQTATAVFSLTALLRHYLSNQESLLVLQEVAKLLHDDLNTRLSQLTTKSTNSTISSNVVATAL